MVDEKRKKRIGEMIQHELGNVLLRHSEQPLFTKITITSVVVSPDLSIARVYFSVFDNVFDNSVNSDEAKIEACKLALKNAAGLLRKALAHNLNLRVTPRLTFFYDDSIKRGQMISQLIDAAIAADEENKNNEA